MSRRFSVASEDKSHRRAIVAFDKATKIDHEEDQLGVLPAREVMTSRRTSRRRSSFYGITSALLPLNLGRRGSLRPSSLSSDGMGHCKNLPLRLENTYRLEPDDHSAFKPHEVQKTIKDVLRACFSTEEYNPSRCGMLASRAAESVRDEIKGLGYKRYKTVCQVTIVPKAASEVILGSRCLWNTTTDKFACESYRNDSLCVTCVVHGVYLD